MTLKFTKIISLYDLPTSFPLPHYLQPYADYSRRFRDCLGR